MQFSIIVKNKSKQDLQITCYSAILSVRWQSVGNIIYTVGRLVSIISGVGTEVYCI